jgi:beta-glucosidase
VAALEERIEGLISALKLDEKVQLVAGRDMWSTLPVERLGIPSLKVTDGPNGARGASFGGETTSACFPCASALAATWNTALVERVGVALGEEARSKGAHVLLAPTVNIHRSPLGGRHFECYSEDPCLAARIAVAYISGVQSRGVGTSVKHFVCNDSEFERHTISSEVPERALREIYLVPFEAAVREAGAWSVMSAYNRLNGEYCSEHGGLLNDILKGEWGFDGFVVSDWFGTNDSVGIANGGLDLEMPGPARHMGDKLLEAVRDGRVAEAVVDDKLRRIFRIALRTGAFDAPADAAEQAQDRPEHRAVAREAAREGAVLLRNEANALPLPLESAMESDRLRSLAVIGPNADRAEVQGGGSARVSPHYTVTPLEGIRARAGDAVDVRYELGCINHRTTPALEARTLRAPDGSRGLEVQFFEGTELEGDPVATRVVAPGRLIWFGSVVPGVDPGRFSARCRASFEPAESGRYTFSLQSAGLTRLLLDGEQRIDNWTHQERGDAFFGAGSSEVTCQVELQAGQPVELVVEFAKVVEALPLAGIQIGCARPVPDDAMERAVACAAECDAAVVVVGLNSDWETEGRDRRDLELPGRQQELIERVAEANPRTVVVLNAGSPVTLDWAERVPAILDVWYPGQELGNALAELLFGDASPSGKLPTSFPKRLEHNPSYLNYPGENGKVSYGEGLFVGYRYYDRLGLEPRFPFGHGLSYTSFAYGPLRLSRESGGLDTPLEVSLDVTNTGERAGQEVVQLYVRDVESSLVRPEKELRAFAKLALEPGQTRSVRLELDRRAFAYWDPARSEWVAEPGEFELLCGSSSRDLRQSASYTLE